MCIQHLATVIRAIDVVGSSRANIAVRDLLISQWSIKMSVVLSTQLVERAPLAIRLRVKQMCVPMNLTVLPVSTVAPASTLTPLTMIWLPVKPSPGKDRTELHVCNHLDRVGLACRSPQSSCCHSFRWLR